ncbi:MAG TPA: VRR-NUC domain-containing protein [Hyphomicrobiales bacterium]|nr:VRR-NUC domain-containing protein [Hyphomicrobiales bacterium]
MSFPLRRSRNAKPRRAATASGYRSVLLEHPMQKAIIEHWSLRGNHREAVLFAIPNGGLRDPATARRLKLEGVQAGVCDIFASHARTGSFWLEVKRPSRGRLSEAQKAFIPRMIAAGQQVFVMDDLGAILRLLEERQILRGRLQ